MTHRCIVAMLSCFFCATLFAQDGLNSSLPTYYIYHGQQRNLTLDPSSIAVRAHDGLTAGDLLQSLAGSDIRAVDPVVISGWFFLRLNTPAATAAGFSDHLRRILKVPSVQFASPVFRGPGSDVVVITPDLMMRVRSRDAESGASVLNQLAPELVVLSRNYGNMEGAFKLHSPSSDGFDVLRTANTLATDPRVEWSEPDFMFSGHTDYIPNDPGFVNLWGFRNTQQYGGILGMDMDVDLAWDITTGSSTVKVLVIDVGVQQNHPDINQLAGTDLTGQGGGGGPVNACDNHGTEVAGCVSAIIDNHIGTVGVAPGCPVLSARAFVSDVPCDGNWWAYSSWTVDALTWGQNQGARVSNNSNAYGSSMYSSAIEAEYQSTYANGMVHFASAGNAGNATIAYPARIAHVNSVAALGSDGALAAFSCWGTGLDFSAPGVHIYTTDRTGAAGYDTGSYRYDSGTSFSSPYAAGVAALVLSVFPWYTSAQVEARMQAKCRDLGAAGYDTVYGWGMVNAYNSVGIAMTFRVNMRVKMRDRLFCPDSGDIVTVRGMFNSWGNLDTLKDPDHDSIYVKTLNFHALTGALYKFWKTPRRDMAYEDSISDRELEVADTDAVLPAVYFNNDSIGRVSVVGVTLAAGWNMISNPLRVTNDSVRILYPTSAFPYVYSFSSSGYAQDYTMENRTGYWGKFPSAITQSISGQRIARDTLSVLDGWNMVGTITTSVDTNTIIGQPSGLRASPWYGYGPSGYSVVTQLQPGNAYWIRANGPGKFILGSGLTLARPQVPEGEPLAALNWLSVTDNKGRSQTLYFGSDASGSIHQSMYALPPLPPEGAFDARFTDGEPAGSGSMVRTHPANVTAAAEFPLAIQSDAYPVTVAWNVRSGAGSYELADGPGTFPPREMSGMGSIRIASSNVTRLLLRVKSGGGVPASFALQQNYPNPFNPTTEVRFMIRDVGLVSLRVYDLLGREVATLVNEVKQPGAYTVEWNAGHVASGVYFYRLQAGGFVACRRLMVLK